MAIFLNRRRAWILGAALLALTGCDRFSTPAFKAVDISGAEYARQLSLPDASGQMRTLKDFQGKVVVVFFGYTQCPDVCPATLAELAAVKQSLGAAGERVQGIFVTVDPERDTAEVLKAYVGNFGADFVALRGDAAQTQAVAKEFKVYYAKVAGQTDTSYTMDHTAGSYVFDAKGQIRLFTRYGAGPETLAHDLKILLDEQ